MHIAEQTRWCSCIDEL